VAEPGEALDHDSHEWNDQGAGRALGRNLCDQSGGQTPQRPPIGWGAAWVNDVQAAVVEPVEADSGRIRYHTACCGWGAAWGDVRAADPLSATDSRGRLKDSRSTFDCRVL